MSVMVKVARNTEATFAEVIDMPFPNILIVKTSDGTFKVHESLVTKFF